MQKFNSDRDLSSWIFDSAVENALAGSIAHAQRYHSNKWLCSDGDYASFAIAQRKGEDNFYGMELECFGGSMMSTIEFHVCAMPDNLKWDNEQELIEYWKWVADCVSSVFCEEVMPKKLK